MLKSILLALLCTLLFPKFISDSTLGFSNSIFALLMACGLYLLFKHASQLRVTRRTSVCTFLCGTTFSLMTGFGYALDASGQLPYTDILFLVSLVLFSLAFTALLKSLWVWLEQVQDNAATASCDSEYQSPAAKAVDWLLNHKWMIVVLLLVCWLPCYLSTFPGRFSYDGAEEFAQSTNGYRGDFPRLHSFLVVRLFSAAFQLTGSYNVGIAFYTIVQMILLACLFAHILHRLQQLGTARWVLAVGLVYYAIFPTLHLLVVMPTRDILFSALLSYAAYLAYAMSIDPNTYLRHVTGPLKLGLVLSLTVLARDNNASILALLLVLAISVALWMWARRYSLRGASILAGCLAGGYLSLTLLLTALCQPYTPADAKGALSLAAQPLARAYSMYGDEWTEAEHAEYFSYFDTTDFTYYPECADPVKNHLDITGNEGDFFAFWLRMGFRYPGCFLDAMLENSKGAWSPSTLIDGYQNAEVASYNGYAKCYNSFSESINSPGQLQSLLPQLLPFYKSLGLDVTFEKIPLVSMLFSIGFQTWLLIHCCYLTLCRRNTHLYLPLGLLLLYTALSCFVPIILLRYFAALFFCFPLVLVFTVQPVPTSLSLDYDE